MRFDRNDTKKSIFAKNISVTRIHFSFNLSLDLSFEVNYTINNQLIFQQNEIRLNQNFDQNFLNKIFRLQSINFFFF